MKEQNSSGVWIAVALLLLLTPPVAYVAAYYLRGEYVPHPLGYGGWRFYPNEREARFFEPGARFESWVTGNWVQPRTDFPIP